jgi:DUF1365 family protein
MIAPVDEITVPALFHCRVRHIRYQSVRRQFEHRQDMWLVDVDDLPAVRRWPRVARFDPADHLGDPRRSLRANLDAFLTAHGADNEGRILMLAQPRAFGHAFDPITLFFGYHRDSTPAWVIAEVRNTFGERHCYLLDADRARNATVPKRLYVSPFLPLDGHYRISVALDGRRLHATVALYRRSSNASAKAEPAVVGVLTGAVARAPVSLGRSLVHPRRVFAAYRTSLLIHAHAWLLRRRGLTTARRRHHEPQAGVDAPARGGGSAARLSEETP